MLHKFDLYLPLSYIECDFHLGVCFFGLAMTCSDMTSMSLEYVCWPFSLWGMD